MATLLETILQYRAGMAEYNANAPQDNDDLLDAFAEQTYAPPFAMLADWRDPATSLDEALAAIQLAKEEVHSFQGSPMVAPLLDAVQAFFAGPVDPKLIELMELHKVAYAAFCAAVDASDRIEINRDPTDAENATYERTNKEEETALNAVLEFPALNRATANAKLFYVTQIHFLHDITTSYSVDRVDRLLWSLVGGKPASDEGRAAQ